MYTPSSFSFTSMLSMDPNVNMMFPSDVKEECSNQLFPSGLDAHIPNNLPQPNWNQRFTTPHPTQTLKRRIVSKAPIDASEIPLPKRQCLEPIEDKKLSEKEKHKVRQRQRRQKMTGTMDLLKSMIPECVQREKEAALVGSKKKKVDQTQLLEMTVEYIQELKTSISNLEHENHILRTCMDSSNCHHSANYFSSPNSEVDSSSDLCADMSPDSTSSPISDDFLSSDMILGKRSFADIQDVDIQSTAQPFSVRTARALMAVLVLGIIFYNPFYSPVESHFHGDSLSHVGGRVLQSTQPAVHEFSSSLSTWFFYFLSSFFVKLITLMFWTFGAMLLDHVYYPSSDLVDLAKRENDIGVKRYDKGDYQGSRRHFEKALRLLGRSPTPSILARVFHLPLELWRQILHVVRIGLWCDVYLVNLRGGQAAVLEIAKANHYLFSLNMLSNNMDSHSVLFFLVSLNTAESLYQKPPVLAEVYATVAIAFYGLLGMPRIYQYLMGKAWHIIEGFKGKLNEQSVDKAKAHLLFLSSYGSLCNGNLREVQSQIQRGCNIFLKEGNKHMFFQGQFFISYTHFLSGNFFTAKQILKSVDACSLGDPRVSWWREMLIVACKLSLREHVSRKELAMIENLYEKVESHSTFAPPLAAVQQSVAALLLLRLGETENALNLACEALDTFDNCPFIGWIFYSGFYISEVFFTIWEEEKENEESTSLVNRISRLSHRLCNRLRKVAQSCELSRSIVFLVIGRYTLNMKEYERAITYFKKASDYAEDGDMKTYKIQAASLIDRTELEAAAQKVDSFV